jgi:hypothetical protein
MTANQRAHADVAGGCPACDLEADEMCVACGLCNCDRHDTCVQPDGGGDLMVDRNRGFDPIPDGLF